MILCGCMIQEGQIPADQVDQLEAGLSGIATHFFGMPAETAWTTVARGDGWTAGEPSSTSLVVMYVPPGLEQQRRTQLLETICDLWTETTGCSLSEIVATARDNVS